MAAGLGAQIRIYAVESGGEVAVAADYSVGSIPIGDALVTRFRVRGVPTLTALALAGSGFLFAASAPVPQGIEPGGFAEFAIRFTPTGAGQYSASVRVNTTTFLIRGSAAAAASLYVESSGARTRLTTGSNADFGAVDRDRSASRRFGLENLGAQRLTVTSIAVTGAGFRLAGAPGLPLALGGRESAPFDIVFEPETNGARSGTLNVDGRVVTLTGSGQEPPLPRPLIVLQNTQPLASAQQVPILIRFDAPSRTAGSGTLSLRSPDAAAVILSTGRNSAAFAVAEGDTFARLTFQTGTVAGPMTLTAALGAASQSLSIEIPAAAATVDTTRATRAANGVEVLINGFDNTRGMTVLSFVFYDTAGRPVSPGAIRADVAADFRRYFETSGLGGLFALKAAFPVTGDPAQIESVEIELNSPAGLTRSERIRF